MIFNQKSCDLESKLLEKIEKIYEKGFPDDNEREHFKDILNRVIGLKNSNDPHSVIVLKNDNDVQTEVSGGLIADWYEKSKCIHLTYIIVDEKYRAKGIAKELINEGIKQISDWIKENRNIKIRNIFFESNNPEKTVNDNFNPYKRLEIFSKLGARRININYIQPALDPEKKEVENLFLLTFPQFNTDNSKMLTDEVIDFLTELYAGLNGKKESLEKMAESLKQLENKEGIMKTNSILEANYYEFCKTSVTYHFIEEKSKLSESLSENVKNYIASFEADMLNFRNQRKPDKEFTSTFIGNIQAILYFPHSYEYSSEGNKHYQITDSKRLEVSVNLSINKTIISRSKKTLWHITIAPAAGSIFTENDLIKLAHNFGSNQEKVTLYEPVKIQIQGEKEKNDILKVLEKQFNTQIKQIQSGIIQIDSCDVFKDKEKWLSFSNLILKERNSVKGFKKFSKTLCGIILGIFDFKRMNEDEIFDTIQPIVTKNASFVVLCRGTLLKLSYHEEICDAINNHIIVDPYLLIPDMVLSHNLLILNNTLDKINTTLDPELKQKLNSLEKSRKEIRYTLSFEIIYDSFQYPSEKEIIKTGDVQRGIESLNNEINQRLNDLSELILVKRGNKTIISDGLIAAFLALIALFQLIMALVDFKTISLLNGILIFISVAFLACGIFWLTNRKKIRNDI